MSRLTSFGVAAAVCIVSSSVPCDAWEKQLSAGRFAAEPRAVLVTPAGDVVTGGFSGSGARSLIAIRRGADGKRIWARKHRAFIRDLELASNGDVLMAGSWGLPRRSYDAFGVARVDAARGQTIWHFDLGPSSGSAFNVEMDSAGDVLCSGPVGTWSHVQAFKLDGDTGDIIWHTELLDVRSSSWNSGDGMALTSTGDVVFVSVRGSWFNSTGLMAKKPGV